MMRVWKPTPEEIKETEQWNTWNKEVSEFPWSYDETETCYILDGEAVVVDKGGEEIRFQKGDMVQFEEGVECTWKIVSEIRKKYIFG